MLLGKGENGERKGGGGTNSKGSLGSTCNRFAVKQHLLDNDLDLNRALELVDASISIRPTWRNHWTKAQILHKLGKKKQAVQVARQAQKLGQGDYIFENFYAADVTRAIESWK